MKKILIAIMMFTCFCMAGMKPTHYFEGKWYYCKEMYIVEPVKPKLPKCSTTKGDCADYDSKGNMIHSKTAVTEFWYDRDTKGNTIHMWTSDGHKWWFEYDAKGNNIHEIWIYGSYKSRTRYEYDDKGNIIHVWSTDGYEVWYKWFYDDEINIKYRCHVNKYGNPTF